MPESGGLAAIKVVADGRRRVLFIHSSQFVLGQATVLSRLGECPERGGGGELTAEEPRAGGGVGRTEAVSLTRPGEFELRVRAKAWTWPTRMGHG